MPDTRKTFPARLRSVLFVAFAACTLWLVVENSILLVVLPRLIAHPAVESRHE